MASTIDNRGHTGCEMRDGGYEIRDTRCGMRDARYEMWDEGYEMDVKSETGGTDDNSRIEISGTPHPVSRISYLVSPVLLLTRIPHPVSRTSCPARRASRE